METKHAEKPLSWYMHAHSSITHDLHLDKSSTSGGCATLDYLKGIPCTCMIYRLYMTLLYDRSVSTFLPSCFQLTFCLNTNYFCIQKNI